MNQSKQYVHVLGLRAIQRPTAEQAQGGALAVQMLAEFKSESIINRASISDEWRRRGTPQRDVVAEYLARLTSEDERAGFTRMLTEALADYVGGCSPSLEWLRCLSSRSYAEAETDWNARKAVHS